jgi:hypothetical protein
MALVVRAIREPLVTAGGGLYTARICGRQRNDGGWEGWVEFEPTDGSAVLRTPRETTQPKLTDLEYWAGGLTPVYLEGAFERAINAERAIEVEIDAPEAPAYEGPAPDPATRAPMALPHMGARRDLAEGATDDIDLAEREEDVEADEAVLNPFSIFAKGEGLLRLQLGVLSTHHLRSIVRAYRLAEDIDLDALDAVELAELIVAGVRAKLAA